jgi:hypothetical protein
MLKRKGRGFSVLYDSFKMCHLEYNRGENVILCAFSVKNMTRIQNYDFGCSFYILYPIFVKRRQKFRQTGLNHFNEI